MFLTRRRNHRLCCEYIHQMANANLGSLDKIKRSIVVFIHFIPLWVEPCLISLHPCILIENFLQLDLISRQYRGMVDPPRRSKSFHTLQMLSCTQDTASGVHRGKNIVGVRVSWLSPRKVSLQAAPSTHIFSSWAVKARTSRSSVVHIQARMRLADITQMPACSSLWASQHINTQPEGISAAMHRLVGGCVLFNLFGPHGSVV